MNKQILVLAMAVLLVFLLGFQTYEVGILKDNMMNSKDSYSGVQNSKTSTQYTQRSAPTMVGGC